VTDDKSKTNTSGQSSSDNPHDQPELSGQHAEAPVFDDDSMFNSADLQTALLSQEQANRKNRKRRNQEAERVKQRKAG
jgi:hypothetical protein